jgi:assimilatory nitrate reductase catalytic subunit
MTRTGKSPRLSQHLAEPFAEIHPADAARYGIGDADLVSVQTGSGAVLVRALLTDRQARGSVFVPMHWNDQYAAAARADTLVPALTDPHSGQPASKHVAARIARFAATFYGFAVLRQRPVTPDAPYWALARCSGGWRLELAFSSATIDWAAFAASLFGHPDGADTLAYHDGTAKKHRFASFDGTRLLGALFVAAEPVAVSRDWAVEQLEATFGDRQTRLAVIAGRPGAGAVDRGATVCSCCGVGVNQIATAVRQGYSTVAAIGELLQAGTNCGSCRSEIGRIIAAHRLSVAG